MLEQVLNGTSHICARKQILRLPLCEFWQIDNMYPSKLNINIIISEHLYKRTLRTTEGIIHNVDVRIAHWSRVAH